MRLPGTTLIKLAYLAAVVLWGGWFFNTVAGDGALDRAGQIVGTDFAMFYSAGYSLSEGMQDRLYDFSFQHELQQNLVGAKFGGTYNFYTTPLAAVIFAPFAGFSYLTAFVLWSLLGLVLLWNGMRFLGYPLPFAQTLISLTFYPVFAAVSFGQNSLLSFFVLCGVYLLWKRGRSLEAGLTAGLLAYKPQLLLGLLVVWLVDRAWRELLGLSCALTLAVAMCAILMPDASAAYIKLAQARFGELTTESSFPISKQVSLYGFFYLLAAKNVAIAKILSAAASVVGLLLCVRSMIREDVSRAAKFSSAVLLTFLLSPHMMIYEMTLLLIPAVLLWREAVCSAIVLRRYNIIIWVSAFISVGAVSAQLSAFNFALQPAALAAACVSFHFWFRAGCSGSSADAM